MEIKVFVSSRMTGECKNEREIAEVVIRQIEFTPILFELEPPASEHIKEWWRQKVKSSDFLILILNKTLSAAVFDEFKTAKDDNNKKVLVFVKDGEIAEKQKLEILNYPKSNLVISDDDLKWFYHTISHLKYGIVKSNAQFMKELREGILQYDQRAILPKELWSSCILDDDPELRRIKKVYVKPKMYCKAEEILKKERFLIITGPANVGKTAMVYYLSSKAKEAFGALGILKIERERLSELKEIENSVILFDDVFGKAEAEKRYANEFGDIQKLKENNFVILTTRKSILDEVETQRTRFGELSESEIDKYILEVEQEGSYSNDDLSQILENHIDYYLNVGKIGEKEKELALKNKDRIISGLRFPHNYELLVREQLKRVSDNEIDIDEAIDNATHIKREAKNWFLDLNLDKKYFVFTVALFPELEEETFERVYLKIVKALQKRHTGLIDEDLDVLRKETSSYTTQLGKVNFNHTDYWEGVRGGLMEKYRKDLVEILPVLKELAKDEDFWVRLAVAKSLGGIGKFEAAESLPILKELANDRKLSVILRSINSLVEIGGDKPNAALDVLEDLVENAPLEVRSIVILVIGEFIDKFKENNSDRVFELLKKLANSGMGPDNKYILSYLEYFVEDRPDEVIDILEKIYENYYSYLPGSSKRAIIQFIADFGKYMPRTRIIEILELFSNDEDELFRNEAVELLEKYNNPTFQNNDLNDESKIQ